MRFLVWKFVCLLISRSDPPEPVVRLECKGCFQAFGHFVVKITHKGTVTLGWINFRPPQLQCVPRESWSWDSTRTCWRSPTECRPQRWTAWFCHLKQKCTANQAGVETLHSDLVEQQEIVPTQQSNKLSRNVLCNSILSQTKETNDAHRFQKKYWAELSCQFSWKIAGAFPNRVNTFSSTAQLAVSGKPLLHSATCWTSGSFRGLSRPKVVVVTLWVYKNHKLPKDTVYITHQPQPVSVCSVMQNSEEAKAFRNQHSKHTRVSGALTTGRCVARGEPVLWISNRAGQLLTMEALRLTQDESQNVRGCQAEEIVIRSSLQVSVFHNDDAHNDVSCNSSNKNRSVDSGHHDGHRQTPDSPVAHVSLHEFFVIKRPVGRVPEEMHFNCYFSSYGSVWNRFTLNELDFILNHGRNQLYSWINKSWISIVTNCGTFLSANTRRQKRETTCLTRQEWIVHEICLRNRVIGVSSLKVWLFMSL